MNAPTNSKNSPITRMHLRDEPQFFRFDHEDLDDGLESNVVSSLDGLLPMEITTSWDPLPFSQETHLGQGMMNFGRTFRWPSSPIVVPQNAVPDKPVSSLPVEFRKTAARRSKPLHRKPKLSKYMKRCAFQRRPRNAWSDSEDNRFLVLLGRKCDGDLNSINRNSFNWNDIAKKMPGDRTAKQCRDRWINFLRPGIKKGDWTQTEETLITELVNEMGQKWSKMATIIPGRSENDIKNKWNSMKRKKERLLGKLHIKTESESDSSNSEEGAKCYENRFFRQYMVADLESPTLDSIP